MNQYNSDRMRAVDNNSLLYEITQILDQYDLARIGKEYPGEYSSEARDLKVILQANDVLHASDVAKTMKKSFGWRYGPLIMIRYRKVASEVNTIWQETKEHSRNPDKKDDPRNKYK